MDEEFAKWFKQMEDDMKKFDNEFYEEFNESNFEISTNSCGFSLERNEEYVKLIGESSSLTDITWKISRMYVYPDHPIPEFFFGFLEDLQF